MSHSTYASFTPTLDDALAAFQAATRLSPWRLLVMGGLFGGGFGLTGYLGAEFHYDVLAAAFGAVFFPPGFQWLRRKQVRRTVTVAFETNPERWGEHTLRWDEAGLEGRSAGSTVLTPWTAFTRVQRTERSILLWRGRRDFQFLPVRALTCEQWATLEPLLTRIGSR